MAPPMIIAAGISAAGSLLAGQSAMAAGRYQQGMAHRNASILDDKAATAITHGENNVKLFDKAFAEQQSKTEMAYHKAGVRMEGTPLEILEYQLAEAELQRMNLEYDADVQSYDFKQQAVLARMEGNLAMFQARQQRTASYISAFGTMVGAYATHSLITSQAAKTTEMIKTQAANQASIINQNHANQKIIIDGINSGQIEVTNKINQMNRTLINLRNSNSLAHANEFGGL